MTSVTVKTGPDKTEYYASMPFDPTGITLEVTYSDKKTEEVTSGFECTGFSSSTAGVKTVTVSYEDMEAGTVYVTVKPKVLIQDSGTAGFAGHNLVDTVQYKNKIYYVKDISQGGSWVSAIYRKDTPSAEPVCVYRLDKESISDFFILKDRIFFSRQSTAAGATLRRPSLTAGISTRSRRKAKTIWAAITATAGSIPFRVQTTVSSGSGPMARNASWSAAREIGTTQYSISNQRILYAEKKKTGQDDGQVL